MARPNLMAHYDWCQHANASTLDGGMSAAWRGITLLLKQPAAAAYGCIKNLMANGVGGFTAYSNRSLKRRSRSQRRRFESGRRSSLRSSAKPLHPLELGLLRTVLTTPSVTNALHEVPTSRQNRPRNRGSSAEDLVSHIYLGRTMPNNDILSRYYGFKLTISLMLRTSYNPTCCVRGDSPVSLGFVDSVRTIQLQS